LAGGILFANSTSIIHNSVIWGNTASPGYQNVLITGGPATFAYSLIEGSGGSINWSPSFGTDGGNNMDINPMFVDPQPASAAPTTLGNYRLQQRSPAANAANNDLYLFARGIADFTGETDLAGNPRLVGNTIDMGAYETSAIPTPTNGIVYVDCTQSGFGTSWEDAYPNLADPLILAAKQRSGLISVPEADMIHEIYVAQGDYFPMYNADGYDFINQIFPETDGGRDNAFVLVPEIKMYGGFVPENIPDGVILPAFGTTGRHGITKLSGNINENNAYHVLIGVNIPRSLSEVETTLVDGFTIAKGNADGIGSITVNNNTIDRNSGGGMYNINSSPELTHIIISGNNAMNSGGGMYNESLSSPVIINALISGNSADGHGGGIYNIYDSSPEFTNVTISGNKAGGSGGGMYNYASAPQINNTIIWRNDDNIYNLFSNNTQFNYSLIEGSGGSDNWLSILGIDGGNNIDIDPLFAAPVPSSAAPTTEGDYSIVEGSPAIFAGNNDLYLTARGIGGFEGETDLAGNARLIWHSIDIGAYEAPKPPLTTTGGIVYVDSAKFGSGVSWAKAYPNLADPLILAAKQRSGAIEVAENDTIRKIFVAQGTYFPMYNADGYHFINHQFPETDGERDNAFILVAGVEIYGGFVPNDIPNGETLPAFGTTGRDGMTLLSGNINGDDENNAYHVVMGVDIPDGTMDGFTISGGKANGNFSNITINNHSIGRWLGGGMVFNNASPTLINLTISKNTANVAGGGISNFNHSSPEFTNVIISGNSANYSGGIYNENSSPIFINTLVSGNYAQFDGGGMGNENSSPVLTNVTFSGNNAGIAGGGIFNNAYSSPKIYNSIIWGNHVGTIPNNIFNAGSDSVPHFSHCLVQGSGGSSSWVSSFGFDAGNNIDIDPKFVDPAPAEEAPTTEGDYSLQQCSPAFGTGNNEHYLTARHINNFIGETDLAGNPRLIGSMIDMGAYEYPEAIFVIFASAEGNGTINPSGEIVINEGDNLTFEFLPNTGNHIFDVLVNGVSNPEAVENGYYTFENITACHTIHVIFELDILTIIATAVGNGTIEPSGTITVNYGDTVNFTFAANNALFAVDSLLVDGVNIPDSIPGGSYTFVNVTENHTIEVIFKLLLTGDENGIFYVDHTKTGDGSSWEDAYPNLADPLLLAAMQRSGAIPVAETDTIREIYVAQGAYFPMYDANGYHFSNQIFPQTDGERDNAFVLVSDVKIYGGFVPDEIPTGVTLPAFGTTGRDGLTILSGEINDYNVYHVVIGVDISNNTLDGFTITGGNANDMEHTYIIVNDRGLWRDIGGGIYNIFSSPELTNLTIRGNTGVDCGGIFNDYSTPILNYVTISENSADVYGGGIFNHNSSPVLMNVIISGNSAVEGGGGIYNYSFSTPKLINVVISGNSTEGNGGGIYNDFFASPELTNVTISGNNAVESGGGIYNTFISSPTINNSIIWENSATIDSNVCNLISSTPTFAYSIIQGSGGSGEDWNEDFGIDGGNNMDTVPFFVAPEPPSAAPTINGDYSLDRRTSPAISMGSNTLYLTARGINDFNGETDVAGNPRLVGYIIDLGAYETTLVPSPTNGIVYVDLTKIGFGTSWADAYPNLADPLMVVAKQISGAIPISELDTIREIYVAEGVYFPMYNADGYDFINQIFPETDGGRDNAFVLVSSIKVYGGFVPQNIPENNSLPAFGTMGRDGITELSGNMNDENIYHVVIGVDIFSNNETVINGFTISHGNADGNGAITVNNNNINRNNGGGIYNVNSSPEFNYITISGNSAAGNGGGIYNEFASSPTFINALISGNSAAGNGGGIYNTFESSPEFTNVTISGNKADENGGGMYNYASSPQINNSIIWGNDGNVYNHFSTSTLYRNSLVEGSGGSSSWIPSFGIDGGNNIDADPLFTDPIPASDAPTTEGDYSLDEESPAISAGDNDLYLTARGIDDFTGETDLAGNPRLVGGTINMGAYEMALLPLQPTNGILYVDYTKSGNGSSWDDAYPNLADPLILAARQYSGAIEVAEMDTIREIYVAQGAYFPMYNANGYHFTNQIFPMGTGGRDNAFVWIAGVKVYGGFVPEDIPAGNTLPAFGTTGRNGITILSGDVNGDNTNNFYHVVIGVDISDGILDGFTITGGNADGIDAITINDTQIQRNSGGGIYNSNSSFSLNHIIISANMANDGAGIYNDNSSPVLINTLIHGNYAENSGGAIYNNGSSPILANVTISGNYAELSGGGIYNAGSSSPEIYNTIIWGNDAETGSNMYAAGSNTSLISHSLIEDCGGSGSDWDSNFGIDGGNNIDADPLFVDPVPPLFAPTIEGNYALLEGSPAISTGDNDAYLSARGITDFTNETDLAGNPRLDDAHIDMGAYEYQTITLQATNGILYVDDTKSGNGSSWAEAYPNLADPLIFAAQQRSGAIQVAATDTIREIYMAEGTYLPMYNADGYHFDDQVFSKANGGRDNAFVLVAGVKIYGGFVPDEIPPGITLPNFGTTGRNGITVLSGDINGDNIDNVYHVVIGVDIPNAILDGLTITGGKANGSNTSIIINGKTIDRDSGGGLYNDESSPTITHVTITENSATITGGAMSQRGYGGGIYNKNSSPVLTNVMISGNSVSMVASGSGSGGGIYNDNSSPILTNVAIIGNSAINGGAIYNFINSSPKLTNVTISGNLASNDGGGIFNAASTPEFYNTIIWGNVGNNGGDNIINYGSIPVFAYSLVQGSGGSSNWVNAFGADNGNNIGADPLFYNPKPASLAPTILGDYSLIEDTPANNTGNDDLYLDALGISDFTGQTDLAGNPRLVGVSIDMGAYEFQPVTLEPANGVIYVDYTKDGDGSSWAEAYPNLADPLILAAKQRSGAIPVAETDTIREIYVAEGTYSPMYDANGYHFNNKIFPKTDGERDNAFIVVEGVKIYGGFVPNEIPSAVPIPSFGTAGRNGITKLSGETNDAHHVVIGIDILGGSLDGFTITGGNANGSDEITVNNTPIHRNSGGAIYIDNSSPAFTYIIIHANSAINGGGIYNSNSSTSMTNVLISGNSADLGGAIYNDNSWPIFTNVTMSGNYAHLSGGAIYNSSNSKPEIYNSIIWGNEAAAGNNVSNNDGSAPNFSYSLIQGCGGSANWNTNLGNDSGNNIDADPLFVAPAPASAAPTTEGNYERQPESPATSAGNNDFYLTARGIINFTDETDLAGNPRLVHNHIDIGAYEWQRPEFTIIATADAGGIIEPFGIITVLYGDTLTFTFAATPGFLIDALLVDEINIPDSIPAGSYTFVNITDNHTIHVSIDAYTPTITATATEGGIIDPFGIIPVHYGESITFTFAADPGFIIDSLWVDDVYIPDSIPGGSYTFVNVTESHTIHVSFIEEFIPVIEIINVPNEATTDLPLLLYGTVVPSNATNQTIEWSMKDAGNTNAIINGNVFFATKKGTAIVTATIVDGLAIGEDYTQDFAIKVNLAYDPIISFIIYPNPTSGIIYIKNNNLNIVFESIQIYDIIGRLIMSFVPQYDEPDGDTITIDMSHVRTGVYIINIIAGDVVLPTKVVKH
jgi:hypothetical protein